MTFGALAKNVLDVKTFCLSGRRSRDPGRQKVLFAGAMGWAAKRGPDPSSR